jgi:uncharacterized DUF497 family protein
MAFEWHSEKAKSNFEKHGVSFEEAESVFDDPLQTHYSDYAHSIEEQRYICLGYSNQGRLITLAYTENIPNLFRIITARPATRKEQRTYESQSDLT